MISEDQSASLPVVLSFLERYKTSMRDSIGSGAPSQMKTSSSTFSDSSTVIQSIAEKLAASSYRPPKDIAALFANLFVGTPMASPSTPSSLSSPFPSGSVEASSQLTIEDQFLLHLYSEFPAISGSVDLSALSEAADLSVLDFSDLAVFLQKVR